MQGINSLRLFARNANMIARRHYGKGRQHPVPTQNDMPVPQGDFFALHAARNRKYNAILATGIVFFSSMVYVAATGDIINFNWSRPENID